MGGVELKKRCCLQQQIPVVPSNDNTQDTIAAQTMEGMAQAREPLDGG